MSFFTTIDGGTVHINSPFERLEDMPTDAQTALIELIRAARKDMKPGPFAEGAKELRAELDRLDFSYRDASRRWPQFGIVAWCRMLNGADDPRAALAAVRAEVRP
jgi:hypothetical protein